jgi:oxygen-independent coproporphyrinogen III oxidase
LAGIYIHIPFCKQACHYCNFHFSTQLNNKELLLNALRKELLLRKSYLENQSINTIYFGGGTPSLLSEKELGNIVDAVFANFAVSKNAEITLEANPDDLSKEKLHELKNVGINRLSIGVQSFIERDLKEMNRAHSVSEAESSVKRAQDVGFENITIDLMYGLPHLTNEEWTQNVQTAIDLQVPHISSYCLTIEEKTALHHFVSKAQTTMVDDNTTEQQFLQLIEMLTANGFEHYEISNFSKDGFISKHNSAYWLGEHYLGLGPSAHSFNGINRSWNVANNAKYINAINKKEAFFEEEKLSQENKYNEYILTRLRTKWGVNTKDIEQRFPEFYNHFKNETEKLLSKGWIQQHEEIFTLSAKGKLFADKAAMELFI